MQVVSDIVAMLAPFMPFANKAGEAAAEEIGEQLPQHIAHAVAILRGRHGTPPETPGELQTELEGDAALRGQLAEVLHVSNRPTQINFNGNLKIKRDLVNGDVTHNHYHGGTYSTDKSER